MQYLGVSNDELLALQFQNEQGPVSLSSLQPEGLSPVLHVLGAGQSRLLEGSKEEVSFPPHPDTVTEAGNYEYYESLGQGATRK